MVRLAELRRKKREGNLKGQYFQSCQSILNANSTGSNEREREGERERERERERDITIHMN